MNAMKQVAEQLGSMQKTQTPEERRRAKNRRYYERQRAENPERWNLYYAVQKLRAVASVLFGDCHAHQ